MGCNTRSATKVARLPASANWRSGNSCDATPTKGADDEEDERSFGGATNLELAGTVKTASWPELAVASSNVSTGRFEVLVVVVVDFDFGDLRPCCVFIRGGVKADTCSVTHKSSSKSIHKLPMHLVLDPALVILSIRIFYIMSLFQNEKALFLSVAVDARIVVTSCFSLTGNALPEKDTHKRDDGRLWTLVFSSC